jgi:hypothetical protein
VKESLVNSAVCLSYTVLLQDLQCRFLPFFRDVILPCEISQCRLLPLYYIPEFFWRPLKYFQCICGEGSGIEFHYLSVTLSVEKLLSHINFKHCLFSVFVWSVVVFCSVPRYLQKSSSCSFSIRYSKQEGRLADPRIFLCQM